MSSSSSVHQLIDLSNAMLVAWQTGSTFHPVSPDVTLEALEPEVMDPIVTTRNLKLLNRSIFGLLNDMGKILVVFKTGEVFYATGYSIGESPSTTHLRDMLISHNEGDWTTDRELLLHCLQGWPVDMHGPIWLPK